MHNHEAILQRLSNEAPESSRLNSLAAFFKVFGDRTRIRILYALSKGEICVCALCEFLHMDQSAVSHQLRYLKDHRLVICRREGKTVYYSLADEHVMSIIEKGYEHLTEE